MVQAEKDRLVFELAWHYLLDLGVEGITPELLDKYGRPLEFQDKVHSVNLIYERMVESLQNRGMRSVVIGQAIGGVKNLSLPLYDFSLTKVTAVYSDK